MSLLLLNELSITLPVDQINFRVAYRLTFCVSCCVTHPSQTGLTVLRIIDSKTPFAPGGFPTPQDIQAQVQCILDIDALHV